MFREIIGVEGETVYDKAVARIKAIKINSMNKEFIKDVKGKLESLTRVKDIQGMKELLEEMFYEKIESSSAENLIGIATRNNNLNSFIDSFTEDYINYAVLGFVHCEPVLN